MPVIASYVAAQWKYMVMSVIAEILIAEDMKLTLKKLQGVDGNWLMGNNIGAWSCYVNRKES
jgi:hypothetical protein